MKLTYAKEGNMTNKSKKLALVGLVAASYAVITIVFGVISY